MHVVAAVAAHYADEVGARKENKATPICPRGDGDGRLNGPRPRLKDVAGTEVKVVGVIGHYCRIYEWGIQRPVVNFLDAGGREGHAIGLGRTGSDVRISEERGRVVGGCEDGKGLVGDDFGSRDGVVVNGRELS
jgi:hypothetical protein